MEADKDGDGKISFEEFCQMVASTVSTLDYLTKTKDVVVSMTLEGV
jgi:Ca2+-binding EF-hand superfamily protein